MIFGWMKNTDTCLSTEHNSLFRFLSMLCSFELFVQSFGFIVDYE